MDALAAEAANATPSTSKAPRRNCEEKPRGEHGGAGKNQRRGSARERTSVREPLRGSMEGVSPALQQGLNKLRMGWVGAPAFQFATPAFPGANHRDGLSDGDAKSSPQGVKRHVDMMGALMLLDKPDGDAQHMALFEAWTLALRAAFLREATALRFDSPYAVAVHGVAMALVSLRWHWELVTHHCTDGGSKLGGLGGEPTDVDGCDASLGLSYASAALFTTLVVVQFTFHLLWASPRGMKTFFFIPQILSISVLIPGRIVLAASGHSIDAATLLWLGVGIGTVSATVVAPSLLRLLLVSAACFASVIAFGSGPDLWHTHAVDAPALVGAAFLSVLSVFVTRLLLNAGGLFATEAEEESNAVAPETAHPDWISRMPSGVVRGTLHDAAAILGTVVWAVRGAIHVLTMRGTLLYAGAWVGTLALFVGVGIMVMTGDRVDLHPAWTLLLLVLWGLQRRNAMDAIKFRDRVIADLIPNDVANALLQQARVSDEKGHNVTHGALLRMSNTGGLFQDSEVYPSLRMSRRRNSLHPKTKSRIADEIPEEASAPPKTGNVRRSATGNRTVASGATPAIRPAPSGFPNASQVSGTSANRGPLRSRLGGAEDNADDPNSSVNRSGKVASQVAWIDEVAGNGKVPVRATMESAITPGDSSPAVRAARVAPIGSRSAGQARPEGDREIAKGGSLRPHLSGPPPRGGAGAIRSTVPSLSSNRIKSETTGGHQEGEEAAEGIESPTARKHQEAAEGASVRSRQETDGETRKSHRISAMVKSFVMGPRSRKASAIEQPAGGDGLPLVYFREFDEVTMVFSDVVGYTDLSSKVEPTKVLQMLHSYFSRLDHMVESVGAYKYDTVGDAYIIAVNLHQRQPQHELLGLRIALGMIAIAGSVERPDGNGTLQIRVGIHTGPAAGGIIGFKRTLLTLCGDTLNTAARMESNSIPGHVRLTMSTASKLPPAVQARLKTEVIAVKGKGEMTTVLAAGDDIELATHVSSSYISSM